MSPRPTIFISSVSKELRSARQLVANTLTLRLAGLAHAAADDDDNRTMIKPHELG